MFKTIIAILAAVAVTTCLAGCLGGPSSARRGITVAYEAADGSVKFRPLEMHRAGPEFLSTGIMQEGHMPAPGQPAR